MGKRNIIIKTILIIIAILGAYFLSTKYFFHNEEKKYIENIQSLYKSVNDLIQNENPNKTIIYDSKNNKINIPGFEDYDYKVEVLNGNISYFCISNDKYSYFNDGTTNILDTTYKDLNGVRTCTNITARKHSLHIDLNGGKNALNSIYEGSKDETIDIPAPTKDGYIFLGWSLIGGGTITSNTPITTSSNTYTFGDEDSTLTATWSDGTDTKKHSLTIDANGGIIALDTTFNEIEGTNINISVPTKEGYTFNGWTLTGNCKITTNTPIETSSNTFTFGSENCTLTAKWKKLLSLFINSNGGTIALDSSITGYEGDTIDIPTPYKTNYIFDGWTIKGNGIIKGTKFTFKDENSTLTAKWIKTYTLSINVNGGNIINETSYTKKTNEKITLGTPTKSGYEFAGWTLVGGGTIKDSVYTFGTEDCTLTAKWNKKYTLTINANGGSISINTSQMGTKGTVVTIPNPTKTGYEFAGWTFSGAGTLSGNKYTFNEGNATINATWVKRYTLNIDTAKGSITINTTQTGKYGKTITIPDPERSGYKFTGWVLSGYGSLTGKIYTFGDGNGTLTATWKNNDSKLTIDVGEGEITINKSNSASSGKTLDIPAPTYTNHTFLGWTLTGGGSITSKTPIPTANNTYTFGSTDGVLKAKWSGDLTPNANGQAIYNEIYDLYINHGLEYCYAAPSEKQYRADAFNGIKSFVYGGNNYYATDCNGFVGIAIWNAMGVAGITKGNATTGSVPSSITPAGPSGGAWVLRSWATTYFTVYKSKITEAEVYEYARVGDLIGASSSETTHIQVYAGNGKVIGNTGGNSSYCGKKSGNNIGTISFRTLPNANTTTTGEGYTIIRAK